MPLVRCPTHDIPYNSENPRGCPACAREKEVGTGQQNIMRELARSSQTMGRPDLTSKATPIPHRRSSKSVERIRPTNPWVTPPPKKPYVEETHLEKITDRLLQRRLLSAAAVLIVVFGVIVITTSGQHFVKQEHPRLVTDQSLLRPLAVPVNVRMETVFSVLGTQAPRAVPNQPRLQRYSYGTDLEVDAINGRVYAISIRVASRVWRGLRVGISEANAQGALALLGALRQFGSPVTTQPRDMSGYSVYRSLDERPRKTIGVEVRPPNGCYDVLVDVQPKLAGFLVDGNRRYPALGEGKVAAEWVVTQIRIVSRSIRGPFSQGVAC
jgi:hypothetical protein